MANSYYDFINHNSNLSPWRHTGFAVNRETKKRLERAEQLARSIPRPEEPLQRKTAFTAKSKNPCLGESCFLRFEKTLVQVTAPKIRRRKRKVP